MTSRPFGTKRAPLVDAFCKSLFVPDKDAEQLAGEQVLSAPAFLDRMLLCLFDALWQKTVGRLVQSRRCKHVRGRALRDSRS